MNNTFARKIIITYFIQITVGWVLLYCFGFVDTFSGDKLMSSIFTSVSAVCVTGLSVVNISQDFNMFGQVVLLFLIQIGGLGFLILSNWIILHLRRRLSLNRTLLSQDIIGPLLTIPVGNVLKMTIIFTFFCEFIGALILFFRFQLDFSISKSIWLAVFHSISAFCNAGFSLFINSFISYSGDFIINVTLGFLIILGGIGFVVAIDVYEWAKHLFKKKKWRLSYHSQIVLYTSAVLLLSGSFIFFIFEWRNPSFQGPFLNRIFDSIFTSITSRTAGFNTVDIGNLTNMSLVVLMALMFIGASPGSTGGGVKTSTIAVIYAIIKGILNNNSSKTELYNKSISGSNVSKALSIVVLYISTATLAVIMLQFIELGGLPRIQTRGFFLEYLFEVISALSTVGLSTGVTTKLSNGSLSVLMFCMFIGRVGPLVLVYSLTGRNKRANYLYPEGYINIA